MAQVEVKKQQGSEKNESGVQRRESERGMARRGWEPFSLTPADFFHGNPFATMKRMQDEMERAFGRFFGRESEGGS